MERLKVAVVGVGDFGRMHAEKYFSLPQVELVGVVDINPFRANEVAKLFHTKAFFDYRDLFSEVRAVSVVVPTSLHFEVSKDFLLKGIDVLLEKPITTTLKEAEELIEIAKERNIVLQVGHLERFNPAIGFLKDNLRGPKFIESHRLSPFKERAKDSDVILDLMIHDIDIILALVSSEISSLQAIGVPVISPQVDIANARLEFRNGCVANITASRISLKDLRKIRIFEANAYFSADYLKQEVSLYKKAQEIQKEEVNISPKDPLEEEIRSFVQSVIGRKRPVASDKKNKKALQVALEIIEQISHYRQKIAI